MTTSQQESKRLLENVIEHVASHNRALETARKESKRRGVSHKRKRRKLHNERRPKKKKEEEEEDRYERQRLENQRRRLQAKMDTLKTTTDAIWGSDRFFDVRHASVPASDSTDVRQAAVQNKTDPPTPTSGVSTP
eukprot:Gregarina_sp_Pseudo_9__5887@NODE_927_length_2058_cov_4_273403_g870_i0_p2_GENE_NODE_927_length_2058_cov_4_273403_g870_i0NODE_927_length_2058_cov_4_273403_g870_i0_p2_ORF_typecomplete_len135_score30_85Pinin_SDK_memA/PF04696_13/0_0031PV1/PF06637_11/0_063eIF3_subunit/PF08597_10/0_19Nup88/PF10168_9/0_51Atg14/PF10186_9/0_73CENPH/PF05837_12/1_8Pex26/PF07163_12/1_5VPS38/PF17649_1/2_1U79_P34/PF03064_16/1_9DUF4407/PF14362_6/5_2ATPsynt_B/PF00430_18/6_4ATPsynt_B/PF00430_18/8_7e03GBP_C/PF02841_14/12_NODE_927_